MRISLNWIRENYIEFISSPEDIVSNLTALGLECNIIKDEATYKGVVLGKVLDVNPIEESDHLKLCEVDIGEKILSIVCGADNVKSNILVPVATIGSSLGNGSFIIKKTKLCGYYSNGMICSEKELDISDSHEGIMILESNKKLGTSIKDILHSVKDISLDIDLTPNRGDCLSHIGVAREIQIFDSGKYIYNSPPGLVENNKSSKKISIEIKDKVACRRYAAKIIKDVSIGPSPVWLKEKIESIGQKSINNVVDAANYVLFDMGHPLHTFDLSKIQGDKIEVRYANEGEKIVTLDNKERVLSKDHLLICDDIKPIAIAGIIGGLNSEITENTKDILIESAYFDPTVIRKGSKIIDLSTEASRRFERDTDIDNVLISMNRLSKIIIEVAGGEVVGHAIDVYPNNKDPKVIKLDMNKCNQFLGTKLKVDDFEDILKKLSINSSIENNIFSCTIPLYRNDISREVDLYEEVARVFGYDNIPVKSSFTIPFDSIKNDKCDLVDSIKRYFSDFGFTEHYSNSLLHIDKINLFNKNRDSVKISNPLSNEMEYLRDSILPGLILASSYNEKRMNSNYKLFEVGAIHWIESKNSYMQENSIGLLWSDNAHKHWRSIVDFDLSMIKGELASFFSRFGLGDSVIYKKIDSDSFSVSINKNKVGSLYLLNKKMINTFEISNNTILAELNMDILISLCNEEIIIQSPSHYPSSSRDIALLVDKKIRYEEIENDISKSGGNLLNNITLFDIYKGEDLGKENIGLALSLKFISNEKTLEDKEIDKYIDNILTSLKKNFNIQQR